MAVSKDLTELVEIDPERVDGVKNPASGFRFLVIKAADETAKDVDKKGNVDETSDISNAEAVLRLLAELIASEAREMGSGQWDEVCDIGLLSAASDLMSCFRRKEQTNAEVIGVTKSLESAIEGRRNELGVNEPMADASKDTGVTNTEVPNETPSTDETPEAPVEKSTAELISEAVAAEVAKSNAAHEETIKGLRDELKALKETPLPGGPKITQANIAKSIASDNAGEIARFEKLAKDVDDRDLRAYYAQRAAELKHSAN